MILAEAIRSAADRFAAAGIETAKGDAEWLAAHVLGVRRSVLVAHADEPFDEEARERFEALVERRGRREPLAYLLGSVVFRGIELEVGPGVLVPRPETEITAERVIARARERGERPTVVDVGTGCGAIALAVAAEVPGARVFATEVTGPARGWALRNLARTGLRVTLLPGSLFDPLHPALGGCVDVVACNPPYVSEADWANLPDEIRRYEPREAVVGGPTGLEVILSLLEEVRLWLAPRGWLVLEVGEDQAARVARLLETIGYSEVEVASDLTGRDRIVEARWSGGL